MRSRAVGDMAEGKRTRPSTILKLVSARLPSRMNACVLLVNLHWVLVPEGGLSHEEFVYQDTKCPPIDCCTMACVPNDLGRQILGRATECVGLSILYFLSKSKVDQLEVAFGVYEDVFGF
jgi:hypothetical protein